MIQAAALEGFKDGFLEHYKREFGFLLEGRPILVEDLRVRAVGSSVPAPATKVHSSSSKRGQCTAHTTDIEIA